MMAGKHPIFSRIATFGNSTSGHFAMMTALTAPVAIVLAAFAVDAGSLYLEKRNAQAMTDLAAIAAAANLDDAQQAALATMTGNGITGITLGALSPDDEQQQPGGITSSGKGKWLLVQRGRYTSSGDLEPDRRFVVGAEPYNAARVGYTTFGTRYFAGSIIPEPRIDAWAVASSPAEATFSVGSRLLALDGGVVNALLGGLLGSELSLSVMDYEALVGADVSLLSFFDALALEAGLEAGSYTQVLDAEVSFGQIANALSASDGVAGSAKAVLTTLARQASQHATLRLAQLIDIEEGTRLMQASVDQIALDVGVMEMITASAIAAGKGRQVALDLGASLPGLLSAHVSLAIGEPPQHAPWLRVGSGGEIVRTAQTRLAIVLEIGGPGGLLGAKIRLPLYLELAYAEARLEAIACPTGRPESVKVAVDARPGIANLYLAEVDISKLSGFDNPMARSPANLVRMPLVSVTAQAHAEIANMHGRTLTFSWNDIKTGRIRQVSTSQIAGSLAQSLFSSLSLDVNVVGLGIGLPGNVTGLLGQTIGNVAPAVDGLLNGLLSTLGLALGQADVRVHGVRCRRAVLVQ